METTQNESFLNDLIKFPKYIGDFIAYIFSFVDNENPKIYTAILMVLKECGPMPISRIGEKLSVAKPNMTFFIDALVSRGWVNRLASEADRRVTNIELTREGLAYLEENIAKLNRVINEKFFVLDKEERDEVLRCVRYLMDMSRKVILQKQ